MIADVGSFLKGIGVGFLIVLILAVVLGIVFGISFVAKSGLPAWIPFIGKKAAVAPLLLLIRKK